MTTISSIKTILSKVSNSSYCLLPDEILTLLQIENTTPDYYQLLSASMQYSQSTFNQTGYIFAQLGLNAEPCSKNCKFCSLGASHYVIGESWNKSDDEVLSEIRCLLKGEAFSDLFLMTTADYSFTRFITLVKKVKELLPASVRIVANIGDFENNQADELKKAGVSGVYHINRLREGVDTDVKVEVRERTLLAIQNSGLDLYYCIEPIGPEHSYEELLVEIQRAMQSRIEVMAVMRRIPVEGTPLSDSGKVSSAELTKIAAVVNLAVRPSRAMNVHEPSEMSLLAGINQLYAELGANPRDTSGDTATNRGFTPEKAKTMLEEAGWITTN